VTTLATLGTLQALFLSTALLRRPGNQLANRMLVGLLVSMALYLAIGAYQSAGLVITWPHLLGWSHPLPLLFGPLLYLYARNVANGEERLHVHDAWHVLPVALVVAWSLPVYLLSSAEKVAFYDVMARGAPIEQDALRRVVRTLPIVAWLKVASGVVYTALSVRIVIRHRRAIRERFSTLDRINLDWLLLLLPTSGVVWSVALLARLLEPWDVVRAGTSDLLIAALMVVGIYLLGYRALHQLAVPAQVLATDADAPSTETPERALLTEGTINAIERRLLQVMESEQPWRSPDLTLAELAEKAGTTTHKLSAVLNGRVNTSFHDFVNGYRVRDVQRQLANPRATSQTLLTIAMDAGFASKSTFNAVFRRQVGMTPSAYRDRQVAQQVTAPLPPIEVRTDPSARPGG